MNGPTCPKCGGPLEQGYGLAGGGIGAYEYCDAEGCDHFEKWQDPEMMDDAPDAGTAQATGPVSEVSQPTDASNASGRK